MKETMLAAEVLSLLNDAQAASTPTGKRVIEECRAGATGSRAEIYGAASLCQAFWRQVSYKVCLVALSQASEEREHLKNE